MTFDEALQVVEMVARHWSGGPLFCEVCKKEIGIPVGEPVTCKWFGPLNDDGFTSGFVLKFHCIPCGRVVAAETEGAVWVPTDVGQAHLDAESETP